jgi:isopentenyl-diphosphate delta-isomerase type 1
VQEITLIKLGGSFITDKTKPYTFKPDAVSSVAQQLKQYNKPLIIVHGSGSFGHVSATKYGGKNGYVSTEGIAKVFYDTLQINALVMKELIKVGLPAISFRQSGMILTNNGREKDAFLTPVFEAVKQGLIPVLYGDVILDYAQKSSIISGDYLLTILATFFQEQGVKVAKIVQVGTTNGFYKNGKTVPTITPDTFQEISSHAEQSEKIDVTGGIVHKVTEALSLASLGITTYLINGLKPNAVTELLLQNNHTGTEIVDPIANGDEHIVLVANDNTMIGKARKLAAHNKHTPLHRGFSLFLFNKKNELLLQQRSDRKKTWPLVWSNSVCGHPQEDEVVTNAAKRRLQFELGISNATVEVVLPDYRYKVIKDEVMENELCPVLIGFTDETPKPNPDEVASVKWISWSEWEKEVFIRQDYYSPWCTEETMLLRTNKRFQEIVLKRDIMSR